MLIYLLTIPACDHEPHSHQIIISDEGGSDCCCCCCCDSGQAPNTDTDTDTGSPCDDFYPAEPSTVVVDDSCEGVGDTVPLDAVVEWQWPAKTDVRPLYANVQVTPVVAPLIDHNGDGSIDELDTPSVVFTAFQGSRYAYKGALVVLNGATGLEEYSAITAVYDPTGAAESDFVPGAAGVALGDLEGDGFPDICFAGYNKHTVVCLEGDGTFKWASGDLGILKYAYPVIADMDGDGQAEVVVGNMIFDSTGNLLGQGSYGVGTISSVGDAIPSVVDLDGDGALEVVVGNAAYEIDGTATWYNSAIADGPTAIADFDLDGQPEVVSVSNGVVSIVEGSTGTLLSTFNLVDYPSVHGGAPTIADYDGDGIPEIGIAGKSAYGTYEFDGTVVWQTTNSDASSNMTGSSVFDFDGDGTAEVVYADEEQLFILNGLTGVDRLASTGFGSDEHASATLQEYPSLADTDGDGSTEIILASADYWVEGDPDAWYGMRSIGSSTSAWMPSRPIWNQHSYSITNINDDGSVPPSPTSNWHTWNNYRTADLSEAPGDWLSNLYPADIEYCVDCEAGEITFYGTVANEGLSDSGPFDVVFLDDGVPIATDPVAGLASGDTIGFGPIVVSPVDWNGTLTIYVDQGLAEEECDELDNEYVVGESPC